MGPYCMSMFKWVKFTEPALQNKFVKRSLKVLSVFKIFDYSL